MLHVTMKAHLRRSKKPLLILGMDTKDAVTIDRDGNLRAYRLTSLKAPTLEAELRWAIDSQAVGGMIEAVTTDDGEIGFEVGK